jgi:DNA-binding transcriptional LysR family regulator
LSHSASVLLNRLLARGKFRHAQVLLKVGELGSLQRTAHALGMTQSSVTQAVAYLERLLDVKLFERHARGMRPTAVCQDLLPVARQVLLGVSAGAEAVAARQQRGQSVVRVAASVAATHGLLVDTLPRFAERFPDVTVHFGEAEGDDQLLAIARGEVDFVACRRPAVIPEGWGFSALLPDRFAVVCSPKHRLAGSRSASLAELADQTWVLAPAGVAARTSFDVLAVAFPHAPRIHPLITRSPVLMRWLLRYEDVLGYLPFTFARPLIDVGDLSEVQMRPHIDIEPLGLLRPTEGLSEAAERLGSYLENWFLRGTGRKAFPGTRQKADAGRHQDPSRMRK